MIRRRRSRVQELVNIRVWAKDERFRTNLCATKFNYVLICKYTSKLSAGPQTKLGRHCRAEAKCGE